MERDPHPPRSIVPADDRKTVTARGQGVALNYELHKKIIREHSIRWDIKFSFYLSVVVLVRERVMRILCALVDDAPHVSKA